MPEADAGRNRKSFRDAVISVSCIFALFTAAACSDDVAEEKLLPSLGASPVVTVSGISSGGYMAGQYQVAFSADVSGAGIVAAGPWGCAKGDIGRALKTCISGDGLDVDELYEFAEEMAAAGGIDGTDHLASSRLFLFRGSNDTVVGAATVDGSERWFGHYLDNADIRYVSDVPVVHGWPTADYGSDCDTFIAPYINNCDYDLAGEILSHLYGTLDAPTTSARTVQQFDQRPFGDASLADFGYVYIPASCESDSSCRVHVFFHGCEQSANTIGTTLVDNAGFNRWAEANEIVVLYPQVEKSLAAPMNPLGCWDWWGYTGKNYLEKTGPQLGAVRKMVAALAADPR